MKKSPDAFRTISEVAEWLDVPTHVLRFWESRFAQVKPVKRAGGRRYYRPTDMQLIGGIKVLLHDQGMTIRGVQKLLRDEGVKHVAGFSQPLESDEPEMIEIKSRELPEEAEGESDVIALLREAEATEREKEPADAAPEPVPAAKPDAAQSIPAAEKTPEERPRGAPRTRDRARTCGSGNSADPRRSGNRSRRYRSGPCAGSWPRRAADRPQALGPAARRRPDRRRRRGPARGTRPFGLLIPVPPLLCPEYWVCKASVGLWRSLVARPSGGRKVAGSSPASPTNFKRPRPHGGGRFAARRKR